MIDRRRLDAAVRAVFSNYRIKMTRAHLLLPLPDWFVEAVRGEYRFGIWPV
jgi:hypothetical protein